MIIFQCDLCDRKIWFSESFTRIYDNDDHSVRGLKILLQEKDIDAIYEALPGSKYIDNKTLNLCKTHLEEINGIEREMETSKQERIKELIKSKKGDIL